MSHPPSSPILLSDYGLVVVQVVGGEHNFLPISALHNEQVEVSDPTATARQVS